MTKYFFRRIDDEFCFSKKYWIGIAKEEGLTEIELYPAEKTSDLDFMFCRAIGEVGEKGNCGKGCDNYKPKNGKSGCCKYLGQLFEPSDELVTIKM